MALMLYADAKAIMHKFESEYDHDCIERCEIKHLDEVNEDATGAEAKAYCILVILICPLPEFDTLPEEFRGLRVFSKIVGVT